MSVSSRPAVFRATLAVAALAASPALVVAGTTSWLNPDGGLFHEETNWDAGVPQASDTAVFDLDTNFDVLFEMDVVNDLLILAEGEVTFDLQDYELGGLVVGENAADIARLTLEDGTMRVTGTQLTRIGKDAGADGELVVSLRADFSTLASVIVGDAGGGTLTVDRGGEAATARVFVADDLGSTGSVVIDGAGSIWTNSGELFLGNSGDGSLRVVGGGTATTGTTFVGDDAGGSGLVTVTGAGSTWINSGNIVVGNAAGSDVRILAGGSAEWNALARLGDDAGVSGTIEVHGAGSRWTCTAELFVGNFGSGTVDVLAGGDAVTTRVKLGDETDSEGTATVDGAGSTWTDSIEIIVGNFGTGLLTISGGGLVDGQLGTIGDDPGSDGTVVVDGAGSRWSNLGLLKNGDLGAGTIRVIDGGSVLAGDGYTQSAAGRLEVVLGPDSSDALDVTGTATLAGALEVTLVEGFEPAGGTTFVLVDAGAIDGAFDSIDAAPGLIVTVEPTRVVVEVEDNGEPCPADIDGSGEVDFDDLLRVLAAWGPCGKDCPEDIDLSGDVGFDDLLAVLAAWGPCP